MADIPDEYVKVLGDKLGAIFHALRKDETRLSLKWNQYRALFAESQERIDLLNRVGRTFFFIIQEVLHDDVLMHIARLVDPENSGKNKENLSLLQLASVVKIHTPQISAEIESLVKQAKDKARFVEDWRHHRLAHTDLNLALGLRAKALPGIDLEQIEEFLRALRNVLRKILSHFWQIGDSFIVYADRDAEYLVEFIRQAVEAKDAAFTAVEIDPKERS